MKPLPPDERSADRRSVLKLVGLATGVSLTGCLGGPEPTGDVPDPVSITGLECDTCGMVIGDNFGPNGEIFYRDEQPAGHDNPARFDSLKNCLFPFKFEKEKHDWTGTGVYVTDYSRVDYELTQEGDRVFISTHVAPESFALAEDVVFVVGSDVQGAMGPDFVPFSDESEADAFAADHGGDVLAVDEIGDAHIGM